VFQPFPAEKPNAAAVFQTLGIGHKEYRNAIYLGGPSMATVAQPLRRSEPAIQTRIVLQPLATPSVLGYFALASGLIIFGTWMAAAWGTPTSPKTFFPFVLLFSGVGQLAAASWAYSARNAVAASIHGAWAAFFLGWGVMWILGTAGAISIPPLGTADPSLGMWFIYMAVISWTTAFAALAKSPGGFLAQAALATGATIAAPAFVTGAAGWEHVAGWLFLAAAAASFYIGAAIMLDNVFGVVVLPLLRWGRGNRPGERPAEPIEYERGDPGVKVGQ
jgi:succinate-acetate transporter protein